MPDEIILRAASEEELPVLAGISATARERYRDLPGFAYVAETPPVSESRFYAGSVLVAASGRRVLGFALTKPVDGFLFLDNISAAPDARGVGSRLLRAVLDHASAANYSAITLTTFFRTALERSMVSEEWL